MPFDDELPTSRQNLRTTVLGKLSGMQDRIEQAIDIVRAQDPANDAMARIQLVRALQRIRELDEQIRTLLLKEAASKK